MEKEQSQEEIMKHEMLELYGRYNYEDGNPVQGITHYNELMFKPKDFNRIYGEQDLYVVKLVDKDKETGIEKNRFEIYKEGILIATIDENKNIQFSKEYLMNMKEIDTQIYAVLVAQDGKPYDITIGKDPKLPDISGNGKEKNEYSLSKEQLEAERKKQEKVEQANEQPSSEKEIGKIAQKSGLGKDDITSCATIDPKSKITDQKSFEDITETQGKYSKVFVVSHNGAQKDNSRFAFWGLTADGQVEQIPGLEERQGVNTGKSIYSINRDGSEVKSRQTSALFTMPNQKEGFSVTIGQYGIVETDYTRISPTSNKGISIPVNSSTQRPTTEQVKKVMNTNRTTDRQLQEVIDNAEHQTEELESEKTMLNNIDNDPNNDKAIDIDEEVTMPDETVTTLRKEAEKFNLSPEDYEKEFEGAQGNCPAEKILHIRLKYIEVDADTADDFDGRGERLTPEEEALRRRGF